jgi:hypothetical protein
MIINIMHIKVLPCVYEKQYTMEMIFTVGDEWNQGAIFSWEKLFSPENDLR